MKASHAVAELDEEPIAVAGGFRGLPDVPRPTWAPVVERRTHQPGRHTTPLRPEELPPSASRPGLRARLGRPPALPEVEIGGTYGHLTVVRELIGREKGARTCRTFEVLRPDGTTRRADAWELHRLRRDAT